MWYLLWVVAIGLAVYWSVRNALHLEGKDDAKR